MDQYNFFNYSLNPAIIGSPEELARVSRIPQPPYSQEGWNKRMGFEDGLVTVNNTAVDGMNQCSLEALIAKRDNLLSNKAVIETELDNINSGENAVIDNLLTEMEEAYEEYTNALNAEAESNPELAELKTQQDTVKQQLQENSSNVQIKETELVRKDNEISEQEACISGFSSELETLRSQLRLIPQNSSVEDNEGQNVKLDQQREQILKLIMFKQTQLMQAELKLQRLQEEKQALEMELRQLRQDQTTLEAQEAEIQQSIQDKSSDIVKTAQEKYNTAKASYESTKAQILEKKQQELQNIQAGLDEVQEQISEAKNQQYEKGDYSVNGYDVATLATQYEGLTNDEMREVFGEDGARFDDGAWCADFVTYMMTKTYGQDNTPDDFYNTCPLYCSCSEMKRWAEDHGRATTDITQVQAGDAIIINTKTGGLHVGIVVSVNPDGTINTIEGNTLDDQGNYDDNNPGQVNRRLRSQYEVNTYVMFH